MKVDNLDAQSGKIVARALFTWLCEAPTGFSRSTHVPSIPSPLPCLQPLLQLFATSADGTDLSPLPMGWQALVAIFSKPRSLYTASDRLEQNCSPRSEKRLAGHPQRGMYLVDQDVGVTFSRKFRSGHGVPGYTSARQLNLSLKSGMQEFPRGVTGRGSMQLALTATPGPDGKGRERMGQGTVCLEDFRADFLFCYLSNGKPKASNLRRHVLCLRAVRT